jgi:hypothetical protein
LAVGGWVSSFFSFSPSAPSLHPTLFWPSVEL